MTGRPITSAEHEASRGTLYALLAYGIWGLFPLYFHALRAATAWEVLAHRIVWTAVVVAAVLVLRRNLGWIGPAARNPRLLTGLAIAAALIGTNWVVYVTAVNTGRTHEAALGYFLNPLVTVGLGIVVLGERLRPLQWVAVSIGALAGVYLTIVGQALPIVALALAFTFGLYGLTKKRLGATLPALASLAAETVLLLPVAVGLILWLEAAGRSQFGVTAPLTWLLIASGAVTALPLVLFAAAARRIPLVTIGLIQFMTPVVQLVLAVVVLHEHVASAQWWGFAIVWLALLILVYDSLAARRRLTPTAGVAPLD